MSRNTSNPSPEQNPSDQTSVTNVRHPDLDALMGQLKTLVTEGRERSFEVGDLVETITHDHKQTVASIARTLQVSRTRLCEMRRTAVAFPPDKRQHKVDFHFYTMAYRCARRLKLEAEKVLDMIIEHGLDSTRQTSAHIKKQIRAAENARALARPD